MLCVFFFSVFIRIFLVLSSYMYISLCMKIYFLLCCFLFFQRIKKRRSLCCLLLLCIPLFIIVVVYNTKRRKGNKLVCFDCFVLLLIRLFVHGFVHSLGCCWYIFAHLKFVVFVAVVLHTFQVCFKYFLLLFYCGSINILLVNIVCFAVAYKTGCFENVYFL